MTQRIEVTPEERAHVDTLVAARPGWDVALIAPLFCDEAAEQKQHTYTKAHPYVLGMKAVLKEVIARGPQHVLDIGSQLAQNVAVSAITELTMVDVRPIIDPALGLNTIQGTATAITFPDASQEMVTSCWVMCHVGDGRYGDALDINGDVKMLREVYRVLQPGGIACLGLGPIDKRCGVLFNAHRIYTWEWLRERFFEIGFTVLEEKEFATTNDLFIEPTWERQMIVTRGEGTYGYVVLRK